MIGCTSIETSCHSGCDRVRRGTERGHLGRDRVSHRGDKVPQQSAPMALTGCALEKIRCDVSEERSPRDTRNKFNIGII